MVPKKNTAKVINDPARGWGFTDPARVVVRCRTYIYTLFWPDNTKVDLVLATPVVITQLCTTAYPDPALPRRAICDLRSPRPLKQQ